MDMNEMNEMIKMLDEMIGFDRRASFKEPSRMEPPFFAGPVKARVIAIRVPADEEEDEQQEQEQEKEQEQDCGIDALKKSIEELIDRMDSLEAELETETVRRRALERRVAELGSRIARESPQPGGQLVATAADTQARSELSDFADCLAALQDKVGKLDASVEALGKKTRKAPAKKKAATKKAPAKTEE